MEKGKGARGKQERGAEGCSAGRREEGISGAGGEEERGAVLRAPRVPWDRPAVAAGRSRDTPAPEAPTFRELPVLPEDPRGHQLRQTQFAQVCAQVCAQPPACCPPASSILAAGLHGPGSPTGCSGQALPAGLRAVAAAAICRVCQAQRALHQDSWSPRFTQNARDTVLLQRPAGSCRGGGRMLWCSQALVVLLQPWWHPSPQARLPALRGSSVCAGTPGEGDVPP